MIGSDLLSFFDSIKVCSTFLLLAFLVTRPMQSSILTIALSSNNTPDRIETGIRMDFSVFGPMCTRSTPQMDAVMSFLEILAECKADRMLDWQELHLQLFQKIFVFKIFSNKFKLIYRMKYQPTMSYVFQTWINHCKTEKSVKIDVFQSEI